MSAEAAELQSFKQLLKRFAVDRLVVAEEFIGALQADPAWEALAARFVRAEAQQVLGERAHVGRLVKGEDAAVADHAADFGQRIKIERRVEQAGGQDAAERAADLHRLDLRAVLQATGDFFAEFAHSQPERNLNHSGVDEGRVEADELRAGRVAGAQVAEGCGALRGDKGNVAERLNVVDDGWLFVDAALSRERRAGRDGAAQPLQAGQ